MTACFTKRTLIAPTISEGVCKVTDSSKVRVSTWTIILVASFKCSLHQNLTSTCFLAYGHIVVLASTVTAASAVSRSLLGTMIARQCFSNHHFGVQLLRELQRRDPAEGTPRLFATGNQIVTTSGEMQEENGRSNCRSMSHNKPKPNRVQIGNPHVQCFIYDRIRKNGTNESLFTFSIIKCRPVAGFQELSSV